MPWLGHACGHCRHCIAGWETYCQQPQYMGYTLDGGYAEYALGYASHVVRVPEGIDPVDAALPLPFVPTDCSWCRQRFGLASHNDFGLVAITRKRTQPSLERTLCRPCTYCSGSGWSKSPETICYDIQQEIKKMAHLFDSKEITVRVNPEIAKALKSGEFVSLNDIEDWTKKDIIVKSDPLLHEEHFDIF